MKAPQQSPVKHSKQPCGNVQCYSGRIQRCGTFEMVDNTDVYNKII